ncbi:MAG: hypothetical protein ACX930_01150 [Erythrobacter sp.]
MKKIVYSAIAVAAFAVPQAAFAQDAQETETFVGVNVGIHDLGVSDEAESLGVEIDDSAEIFGVFAGVDFPLSNNLFAGIEGNFNLGTGPIDSEYGAAARFGVVTDTGSKFYVRGGYQEIDFDPFGLLTDEDRDLLPDDTFDGVDTSRGDYLVGVGADFPIGQVKLRANVDTVSFDTVRATAGVAIAF